MRNDIDDDFVELLGDTYTNEGTRHEHKGERNVDTSYESTKELLKEILTQGTSFYITCLVIY